MDMADNKYSLAHESDRLIDEAIIALKKLQNCNRAIHEKEQNKLKQRLDHMIAQNTALNDQLLAEKERINEYQSEIASLKEQNNHTESELATLQNDHQNIFDEKNKLTDEILTIKKNNTQMSKELKTMADKLNVKENQLAQLKKHALHQNKSYLDLQKQNKGLKAEKSAKSLDLLHNATTIELNRQIETLRMEKEMLLKRLDELDEKYVTALNTIQTLIEEPNATRATNTNPIAARSQTLTTQQHSPSIANSEASVTDDTEKSAKQSNSSGRTKRRNMAEIGDTENESNDTHDEDAHVHTVPAKRRSVATSEPTTLLRVRPLAELQEKPSERVAINGTSDSHGTNNSTNHTGTAIDNIPIEIDASPKQIINSGGKVGADKMFRCTFPDCNWVKSNEFECIEHVSRHDWSSNRLIHQIGCALCKCSSDFISEIVLHLGTVHDENDHLSKTKSNYKRENKY